MGLEPSLTRPQTGPLALPPSEDSETTADYEVGRGPHQPLNLLLLCAWISQPPEMRNKFVYKPPSIGYSATAAGMDNTLDS